MNHMNNLEESILQLVNAPGYRPVKPRVIAQQLKLPKDQAADVQAGGQTTGPPRAAPLWLEPSGHAVAARAQAAPTAAQSRTPKRQPRDRASSSARKRALASSASTGDGARPAEAKDIYIPADRAGDAATGDVVAGRGRRRPRRGEPGPRGEIVEVVERQTHQFVGTYFESAGAAYVQIDGALFARPIYVGDPGAKNAQPDDKVVIEMVRFPSPLHDGEGVIAEVLGPRGKPGVDTLSIIREFNLPDHFAEDALDEARRQAETFDEAIGDRTDFTGETIVTIDPVDARDFDDAISLERLDNGHWRLGVHIADVSHFVRPNTALDREALERATSVYLPDRVLPMLPEVISNGLASLQPGKVRYTKSAVMEFTAEGLRVSTELHSAAIRSSKRLTYEQVDEFLADREALAPQARRQGLRPAGPHAHAGHDAPQAAAWPTARSN